MRLKMQHIAVCVAAAGAMTAISTATAQEEAGFEPEGDIEFVVPFGAGGGSDTLARTITSVIGDLDLMDNDIIIENRPGGSGARGYQYLAEQEGDPSKLGTVSVSFFTTPLLGSSPVNYEDFTPVAAIAMSPYIAVVPAESDIQSIDDLMASDRITTGTVGVVSDAALLARMMEQQSETTVDAVPFDGEGEVISALLGGHIDFMFGNPAEIEPQIEGGKLRALAVSTEERLPSLPDVPTFQETGFDIDHVQLRGVVLPGGVPQEAVDFWAGIMEEVATSDAWQTQYLDRFGDEPRFEDPEAFAELMKQTNDRYATMMEELDIGQ